jgi:hypothetical protein
MTSTSVRPVGDAGAWRANPGSPRSGKSRSRPLSGNWMHEMGNPAWKCPMQAWLQPMQARMSSSRPCAVLAGSSGSQIRARVMTQRSACPAARMASASCGWLIRPATITGTRIAALARAASGAVYAFGMGVGGTMWSEPASVAEVPATTLT